MFQDKYHLTSDQSLFLAKKTIVENVYSGVKLEGVNATYPETKTILEGFNVAKLSVDDILVIRNLRNAWRYILSNFGEPFDLNLVCKINENVSNGESLAWGVLRNGNVGIGGTDYIPPIPNGKEITQRINQILSSEKTVTEKALDYYVYGCRNQLFWDGNKRTSWIAANKIMLDGGAGILQIDDTIDMMEFNRILSAYYTSGNETELKRFLYENCIRGVTLEQSSKNSHDMEME